MNPEANRCLLCKNARCSAACAVHTNVPVAMKLYREGNIQQAAEILFENNPLSAITSQVCDWRRMCFGHCVLNVKKQPVQWYEIEQEISMAYLKTVSIMPGAKNGKKVALIGAGPVGITAAIYLIKAGYDVTMFDNHERIGGVLRYGIPDFRLDKSYVDEYERILLNAGLTFKGGVTIGEDITLSEIRKEFDATLLGSGATRARRLNIPGEENPHVIPALTYLDDPEKFTLGKNVVVVGGGNVAMDASRTAIRTGAKVINFYRKSYENMPANSQEVTEAKEDGVEFRILQTPVEIKVVDGQNIAVIRDCKNTFHADGTIYTKIIDGTDHDVPFDDMIVAVSESVDYSIFGDEKPQTDSKGWPIVNGLQQTSFHDLFLAGDFLLGPKTVVMAVQTAKIAAQGIDTWLK